MKENKSISRSIRMTETVYNYVSGHVGDGFNQKFENICHRFMWEEAELDRRIKEKRKLLAEMDRKADAIKKGLYAAENVNRELERVQSVLRGLIVECDSNVTPGSPVGRKKRVTSSPGRV